MGHEIYRTLCGTSPLYIKPSSLDIKLLTWLIKFAAKCRVLVIATGHGMLGLTLATGTGKIVTDLVYDKTPDINIRPFGINRF